MLNGRIRFGATIEPHLTDVADDDDDKDDGAV